MAERVYKLEAYANQRILCDEEVFTGKMIMNFSGILFGPQAKMQGLGLYAYIRYIEDHVDFGHNPGFAHNLLQKEISECSKMMTTGKFPKNSSLEERQLLINSLESMEHWKKEYVLMSIIEILTGINLDNKSIQARFPLDAETMQQRHLYESMSGFQIMSAVFWERMLLNKKNPAVEHLFRTWIIYDALCDLDEDLSAGLVLFPKDDLDKFNISLKQGEKVDSNFAELFKFYKPIIVRELAKSAKAIHETNIPKLYTNFLWVYFMSRIIKLSKTQYPVKFNTTLGKNYEA